MAESKHKPVAAIVGVGPGLGASLARRFAREYAVAISARSADYLRTLAEEIRAGGGVALEVRADAADPAQAAAAMKTIRDRLGEVDVLIYNAGAGPFGDINEVTPAQFENCMRVNALGAFVWVKECAGAMTARARGTILITGATAGVKAGARSAAFGPANFAKRGLAQSLARAPGP